jgi:hypothetical protein
MLWQSLMYSDSQLTTILNEKNIQYLRNKYRGGSINQKGNSYENFFAIYQLALLAKEVIEQEIDDIAIFSQRMAFVDDLIIDRGLGLDLHHFQIKESKSLSWGTNKSKIRIAFDFRLQSELNTKALNRNSKISVVVSSEDVSEKLIAEMPTDIQAYSSVILFPYQKTIEELLQVSEELKESISYLTAFDNPAPDKIECVAKILIGAWASSDTSKTTVIGVLQAAQTCQPSFIRSFKSGESSVLEPEFISILQNINGFTYLISRGFFHWEYLGAMDGTYPFSLESEEFQKLQRRIIQIKPTTFDDLENLL